MLHITIIKKENTPWVVWTRPGWWPFWSKTECATQDEAFDVAMKWADSKAGVPQSPPQDNKRRS